MSLTTSPTSLKNQLDGANPTPLADMLRAVKIGSVLRALPTELNGKAPLAVTVDPYVAAAAIALSMPDDAKAAFLFRGYGRAGTATPIELVVDAAQTGAAANPAANHVGISPNGDLVFHGADAWTSVDLLYLPGKYDVVELTLPVVGSSMAIPATFKAMYLFEAEVTVGVVVGKKIIDGPATATALGHVELDAAKANVIFNAGDVVAGTARVKFGVYSATDVDALLEAVSNFI
jgi:hypothetical protein